MTAGKKIFLMATGLLAAFFVVAQLVLGQLIASGKANLVKAHQHTGYTTVALATFYIFASLWVTINLPTERRSRG